jgi:hypothetical protein
MKLMDLHEHFTVIGPLLTFSEKPGDYNEIHFAATAQEETSSGLVRKEILRTGSWPVIPTKGGIVKKPLTIVLDGESNRENGVISLAAVKRGFDALKGKFKVQVPLSDDDDDHKNITRLNTGYVEELFIQGDKLVADILFTEADVKQKVLNRTYSDVSCGIPWEMVSRGEKYITPLEHLCITNRPFIDGLGEFIAMSDGAEQVEITHFAEPGEPDPAHPEDPPPPRIVIREIDPFGGLSLLQIMEGAKVALPEIFSGFSVEDVSAKGLAVVQEGTGQKFLVPFKVEENKVVPQSEGWAIIPTAKVEPGQPPNPNPAPPPETPPAPTPPAPAPPQQQGDALDRELVAAQEARRVRLGVAASQSTKKEAHMPLTREELEALNLSDMPEGQRAAFQKLIDENSSSVQLARRADADKRITVLEDMGFKGYPGALKLYRDVMLNDDGSPAVVVLSDDGKQKSSKTALEILDDFIEAIKGAEGKVTFSDQASLVPDDRKPPLTPEGEKKPFAERLADMKSALAGVNG